MSELKDEMLSAFPLDDRPQVIFDNYDEKYFGNGEVALVFHGVVVRVIKDRSDIFAAFGLLGGGFVSGDNIVGRTHVQTTAKPDVRSAKGVGKYLAENADKILTELSRSGSKS